MNRILISTFLICATAAFATCAGSIPTPNISHAERASQKWNGTTLNDLNAGREYYIQRCSGCHSLKAPARYSPQQWEKFLAEMKTKAGVKDDEEKMILKYLVTISETENEIGKR